MAAWHKGLIGTLLFLALAHVAGIHDTVNRGLTDVHWRWSQELTPTQFPQDIMVVAIDDKSVSKLGRLKNWSRSEYGRLLNKLSLAKVVGFDILFTEPDERDPAGDQAFQAAVKRHGKVVIAFNKWNEIPSVNNKLLRQREAMYARFPPPNPAYPGDLITVQNTTYEPPLAGLLQGAAAIGFADVNADRDGVYRQPVVLKAANDGSPLPHFTVAISSVASGTDLKDALATPDSVRLGTRTVPLEGGMLRLQPVARRFSSQEAVLGAPVPTVSFSDVLTADPKEFEGKVLIVGETAAGTTDIRANPLDAGLRGVELNAEMIANLLHLQPVGSLPFLLEFILVALAAGVPLWLYTAYSPKAATMGAVVVLLAAVLVMEGGFWVMRLIPSWSWVLIAAGSSTLLMGLQRLQQEEERKRLLHQNFSQYVPPKLVEMLVQNPDKAQEQGTRQRVAILFSDVRNFTTYSEQHEPEIVVRQMREYLDEMTISVQNADGVLDKYIGDAVMALYGPFLPESENISARAVLSALDMLDRLDAINAGWREEGLSEFRIGIGIHTGQAIVGNIGTPRRQQFTALGDTVNLAARLESSTKELKASILVSEPVKDEAEAVLGKVAEFIDRGSITVKGREQAVRVYAVQRKQPGTDEEASYARDEEERLQPA